MTDTQLGSSWNRRSVVVEPFSFSHYAVLRQLKRCKPGGGSMPTIGSISRFAARLHRISSIGPEGDQKQARKTRRRR